MALKEDLDAEIKKIFREQWNTRYGNGVPESVDLKLGNDAVKLDGTVLYADLSGSTNMVDNYKPEFAAEIYKAYLHCSAKLIRNEGGVVTAYDGDRVMGIFIGDSKNTSAVRCGLKINAAVQNIINLALKAQYPKTNFTVRQVIGIDTSSLWVARTGVRGANDLVWVGRAANHAAKLSGLSADYPTWITSSVYDAMHKDVKFSQEKSMWEKVTWTAMNNMTIYRSTYLWNL